MRTPEELSTLFRQRGLKVTPQRQLLFRLLHDNVEHPTAEAVYAAAAAEMPTMSLRTVYQTLNDLAEMGEIRVLDLGTGSARFDPKTARHGHLVCDRCGKVRDVDIGGFEAKLPRARTLGFSISDTEIVFRGRCRECQQADRSSSIHDQHKRSPIHG